MKDLTRFEKKQHYENYINNIEYNVFKNDVENGVFESLGINDDVLDWTNFLYSIVENEIYLFAVDLEDEKIYKQTTLEQSGKHTNSSTIDFNIDDMKKLIIEENLNTETLNIFEFKIDISFIDIEKDFNFDIEFSTGYYDEDNNQVYFDLYLPSNYLTKTNKNETNFKSYIKKYFKNYIKAIIGHELLHVFEFYQKTKNNRNDITKDILLNFINNTVKQKPLIGTSTQMRDFLELIYLQISFEENARITQIYIEIENDNIKTQDDFWKEIKETTVWKEMYNLKTFNADEFYSNLEYKLNDTITDESIINIFKSLENDEDLKELITQAIFKDWDNTINQVNNYYDDDIELKNVPESVINDPIKFFEYYEKKFHKTWENFNKNVGRLYTKFI